MSLRGPDDDHAAAHRKMNVTSPRHCRRPGVARRQQPLTAGERRDLRAERADVLGLVADNDVAVAHANGADATDDLTIDAAIMSLNHLFYVQNWSAWMWISYPEVTPNPAP